MIDRSPYDSSILLHGVEEALKKRVHDILKEPLMKIAETEIDKAVSVAVDSMNIDLHMFRDQGRMREVIEIIHRRGNNGTRL